MRQILVALLLPAALAACGGSGGSSDTTANEAAAPADEAAAPATQTAQPQAAAPAAAPLEAATIAGAWTTDTVNGRQGASYVSTDGGTVISFACLPGEEGGPNSFFVRTVAPAGPPAEQIEIFGGGGSGGVPVSGGGDEGGVISGQFDPSSTLGQSLATGLGNLRIRVGATETIIPNSEQVEAVVEACWPSLEERIAAIEAEKAAADAAAAAESAADGEKEPAVVAEDEVPEET